MSSERKSNDSNPSSREGGRTQGRWASFKQGIPVLPNLGARSLGAEQYRNLALQVDKQIPQDLQQGYILALTSADSGTGKTLTSLNLALAVSRKGERRTLIVEADLWRPALQELLVSSTESSGLGGLLRSSERRSLKEDVVSIWGAGLDVLVAGESGEVEDLVIGERLGEILKEACSLYEIVIVDCPPVALAVTQAVTGLANGVLVVARSGQTRKESLEDVFAGLEPERVVGLVLNDQRRSKQFYYPSYGSYDRYLEASSAGSPTNALRRWWKPRALVGLLLTLFFLLAGGSWALWRLAANGGQFPGSDYLRENWMESRLAEEATVAGNQASELPSAAGLEGPGSTQPRVELLDSSGEVIPPVLVTFDRPLLDSLEASISGVSAISFEVLVDRDGKIVDVRSLQAGEVNPEIEKSFVEVLSSAQFSPAKKAGVPTEAWALLTFTFSR